MNLLKKIALVAMTVLMGTGVAIGVGNTLETVVPSDQVAHAASEAGVGTKDKITVYFAGVEDWGDMKSVHIGLNNQDWTQATEVNADAGRYKVEFAKTTEQTALNAYFVNTSNQYRHPTTNGNGGSQWDTNFSKINILFKFYYSKGF